MANMIHRLLESKQRGHPDPLRDSEDAGQLWAVNEAEYHELVALAKQRDSEEGLSFSRWTGPCVWSPGELFYFYIVPENEGDRDKAQAFWQKIKANPGSADHVSAFAKAALDQRDQVKSHVSPR